MKLKVVKYLRMIKKKAISPVIAAVLLIGLVVMGGAVLMVMILPLLNPAPEFEITNAYIVYDAQSTIDYRDGTAEITIQMQQKSTVAVEVNSIELRYTDDPLIRPDGWEIGIGDATQDLDTNNTDGAWIFLMSPVVTPESPQTITQTGSTFSIMFRLPNYSGTKDKLYYKVVVSQTGGESESTEFTDEGMSMDSDAPTLTFNQFNPPNHRTRLTVPLIASVSDKYGGIKNVTYEIYKQGDATPLYKANVTAAPYNWDWNTREYQNGAYEIKAITWDHAGWSATNTTDVVVDVDNDYTPPTILNSMVTSDVNQEGERGETIEIEANVTDTGYTYFDSTVEAVYLHYILNKTGEVEGPKVTMTRVSGNATWGTYRGTIPSSAVNHEAITNNLTYYIEAIDSVGNTTNNPLPNNGKTIEIFDTTKPNFSHDYVTTGYEKSGIEILTNVTDTNEPANFTTLYYRKSADTVLTTTEGSWQAVNMTLIDTNTHTFYHVMPSDYATLDGIDYFMNASDAYGNPVNESSTHHHINIPDTTDPVILEHFVRTTVAQGTNLTLSIDVSDNDPTFDDQVYSYITGKVQIFYRFASGGYTDPKDAVNMSHIGSGVWEGTILSGNFTYPWAYGMDYYILSTDNSSNTALEGSPATPYNVAIIDSGFPVIARTSDPTLSQTTNPDDTFTFSITNVGSADGTITHLNISYSGTITAGVGINEIYIGGAQKWTGTWGGSNTTIDITDTALTQGAVKTLEIRFNDTLDYGTYDFNVTVTHAGGTEYSTFDADVAEALPTYSLLYQGSTLSHSNWPWDRYDILSINIKNTGDTMTVTKIRVTFTAGDSITTVEVPTPTVVFSGSGTSGQWLDFQSGFDWTADLPITIVLRFSGNADDSAITIEFMTDTSDTVSLQSFTAS
ncbi:MAG: Ig-like domain-containing protein [Candidatus Hodarchaeales archaeon]|jgi:hypothetical protein